MSKSHNELHEFGPYRLDTAKRLLLRDGQVVTLKPKTFDLLVALIESHGRVLTKAELMTKLWPDTFVEEANLSFQISALRKALGEEGQQWIETLPKHGYRFTALDPNVKDITISHELPSETKPATDPISGGRSPFTKLIAAGVCLAAGIVIWRVTQNPVPPPRRELIRLTSDAGLTTDPAISPDGRFVAYASDRLGAASLDIWVRQLSGGDPIRIVDGPTDDREPAFSPDGSQIAFRSERDGGGIYVVPALGGQPKLLAKFGRRPRYSPDGTSIAYWVGSIGTGDTTGVGSGRVFVVTANGGAPREVQPQFAAARYPVWSPDGKWLLFVGNRTPIAGLTMESRRYAGDWFVASADGSRAQETGVFRLLEREQLSPTVGAVQIAPGEWRDDRVIFAAASGDSTNLWQVRLSTRTLKADDLPKRVTFGTGLEVHPAIAAATRSENSAPIVFAGLTANMDIWELPLSPTLPVSNEPKRLTEDASADYLHKLSPDGTKLLFVSNRTGKLEIWMKDLASGVETPFISTRGRSMFSADGTVVGHTVSGPSWPVYVTPAHGGIAEKLCDRCGTYWHWTSDRKRMIYVIGERPYFEILDLRDGKRSKFLQDDELNLYLPFFSPDDRWVLFMTLVSAGRNQAFLVPATSPNTIQKSDWIPVTDGNSWVDALVWSPDGARVYFLSESDGFRCIWTQNLDPVTKRRAGDPVAVYHSHRARLSLMNLTWGHGSLDIGRQKVVFGQGEITGNLWMTRPVQ